MAKPAVDLAKVGKTLVKSVTTGEFCRLASRRVSSLKPQLDAHNVGLVGVGLEELGVEEFVGGKFWAGDLYIDEKKQCYKDLGYKRLGFFKTIGSVFGKSGRSAISKAKEDNIGGNMSGDGFQNGGTIIVSAGGSDVLLSYVQEHPAEHVDLQDVLKALKIDSDSTREEATGGDASQ